MQRRFARSFVPGFLGMVVLIALAAGCGSSSGVLRAGIARYQFASLVSDQAGVAAHTDANLVNPWGVSFSPTGPFWVSNNHSNTSTIYSTDGTPASLVVHIDGNGPTGQVFNGTANFPIGTTGPAVFIFATESGTLAAWNGASGTRARTVVDRSSANSVYKGLTVAASGGQNFLYATDFHNRMIDRFDANFNYVNSFTDADVPVNFAPFNVQTINGNLYVTYAKQLAPDFTDDEAGAGNGFVDVFSPDGTLLRRLISRGQLNSPWGLAIAPSSFGTFGGKLLVGNFGDGKINAYDPNTGEFLGAMLDANGAPVVLPGLWTLVFGNGGRGGQAGTLYITAGPDEENHGIFGSITPIQ